MREYFKFETLASATGIAVLCHIVGPLFLLVFIIVTLGVGASLAFVGVIWWPVIGVFIWGLRKKERYAARAALPVFSLMFAIPLLALMIWAHIETTRAQIYFDSQDHTDRISTWESTVKEYTVVGIDYNSIYRGEKLALMRGDVDRIVVLFGDRDFEFKTINSKARLSSASFSHAEFVGKPMDLCKAEDFDQEQLTYLLMKPDLPFCAAKVEVDNGAAITLPNDIIFKAENPDEYSRGLYRGQLDGEISLTADQPGTVRLFVDVTSSTQQWETSFGYPLALPLFGFNRYGFQFQRKVTASKNKDLKLRDVWGDIRGFSSDEAFPDDMYLQGVSKSPGTYKNRPFQDADISFELRGFDNRKWGKNNLEALQAQGKDLIGRYGAMELKAHLISVNSLMRTIENRSDASFEGVPSALPALGLSLCLVGHCDDLFVQQAIKSLPKGGDDFHFALISIIDGLSEDTQIMADAAIIERLKSYLRESMQYGPYRNRPNDIPMPQIYRDRYEDRIDSSCCLPQ